MTFFALFVFSTLGTNGDSCVATADCEAGLHCRNHQCVDRGGQAVEAPAAIAPSSIPPSRAEYDAYMAFRKAAEAGHYPIPDLGTWRRIPNQADWLPYFQYRKTTVDANKKPLEFDAWQKKQTLGILVLTSTPPGVHIMLDGRDYGVTPERIEDLTPGTFHLRATHDGYASLAEDISVARGENQHALTLDDLGVAEIKDVRMWRVRGAIIAGVVGGAAVITGITLLALMPSADNDYFLYQTGFTQYSQVLNDINQHNTMVATACVMFGLAAALGTTSLVLLLTGPKAPETSVGVAALPGGAALTVRGVLW